MGWCRNLSFRDPTCRRHQLIIDSVIKLVSHIYGFSISHQESATKYSQIFYHQNYSLMGGEEEGQRQKMPQKLLLIAKVKREKKNSTVPAPQNSFALNPSFLRFKKEFTNGMRENNQKSLFSLGLRGAKSQTPSALSNINPF